MYPDFKDKILEVSNQTNRLTKSFIQEFYQDLKISIDSERIDQYQEIRGELLNKLAQFLYEIPKFRAFAEKRAINQDITSSLKYMAEHSLYMRDPVTEGQNQFLVDTPTNQTICMVGGKAEEIFYGARTAILDALNVPNSKRNNQIILNQNRIPAYYRRFEEPIISRIPGFTTFSDYLNQYNPEIKRDFINLCLILSGRASILANPIPKNIGLSKEKLDACETGFSRLIKFLNNL